VFVCRWIDVDRWSLAEQHAWEVIGWANTTTTCRSAPAGSLSRQRRRCLVYERCDDDSPVLDRRRRRRHSRVFARRRLKGRDVARSQLIDMVTTGACKPTHQAWPAHTTRQMISRRSDRSRKQPSTTCCNSSPFIGEFVCCNNKKLNNNMCFSNTVYSPPGSPHSAHITSSQSAPSLWPSITPSAFHSRLKNSSLS